MKKLPDPAFDMQIDGNFYRVTCTVEIDGEKRTACTIGLIYSTLFSAAADLASAQEAENMLFELSKVRAMAQLRLDQIKSAKASRPVSASAPVQP